ncbi:Serine protease [Ceratobasidium theobromae]|uniref:Serine protease n=1 Tax=Ceratobasidium theobromae TaxID=1582974 RepID=A0A5N5QLW4_9AGAM|nr:Serine protease [Ceratobasidium theobromae]
MFISTAASILALSALASAIPAAIPITKYAGPAKADSYIIKLKNGVSKSSHIARLLSEIQGKDSSITYKWDNTDVFHGYAGVLKGSVLDFVRKSSDVEYIEADTIWQIDYEGPSAEEFKERSEPAEPAFLGLAARATGGSGVVIYGIDTGIYTAHSAFGGRASWGATYGGYASADGNGHGTHTAGTAVGTTYGIATQATIVAVKVCSDSGSCATSDIVSGVNYALAQFKANGKPSVATMSLGGSASTSIDNAVSSAISSGLHFTIAAGNSNVNAANSSPARVAAANTVGAIDSNNAKASFSNYGAVLDVWAPGVSILSAYIGSTTATARLSGTSMATPYVAGILAYVLSEYGQVTPASLSDSLKSHAQAVVTGAPSGTTNLKATLCSSAEGARGRSSKHGTEVKRPSHASNVSSAQTTPSCFVSIHHWCSPSELTQVTTVASYCYRSTSNHVQRGGPSVPRHVRRQWMKHGGKKAGRGRDGVQRRVWYCFCNGPQDPKLAEEVASSSTQAYHALWIVESLKYGRALPMSEYRLDESVKPGLDVVLRSPKRRPRSLVFDPLVHSSPYVPGTTSEGRDTSLEFSDLEGDLSFDRSVQLDELIQSPNRTSGFQSDLDGSSILSWDITPSLTFEFDDEEVETSRVEMLLEAEEVRDARSSLEWVEMSSNAGFVIHVHEALRRPFPNNYSVYRLTTPQNDGRASKIPLELDAALVSSRLSALYPHVFANTARFIPHIQFNDKVFSANKTNEPAGKVKETH